MEDDPARRLVDFLEEHFVVMSCGGAPCRGAAVREKVEDFCSSNT